MADLRLLDVAPIVVIDLDAPLPAGSRAAGDYDNSGAAEKWPLCDAYLVMQYDTGPPMVGVLVADLYMLRGDGGTPERFPAGGDGSVGANLTPASIHLVGSFECRAPSLSVDEPMLIPDILLGGHTNRFVVVNASGETGDSAWQLDIVPHGVRST